jgi:hypothetical protein
LPLYLGEYAGARVLTYGTGISQVDTDYQLDLRTWDLSPAGATGDVLFCSVNVAFRYSNGYALGITPYVDGVALTEQSFSGSGTSEAGQAQATFRSRGSTIATRIRTLSRSGTILVDDVQFSGVVIRVTP